MKKRIVALLMITVFLLCGCDSEGANNDSDTKSDGRKTVKNVSIPEENPNRNELIEQVQVSSVQCTEDNGRFVLNAQVSILPYGEMMEDIWAELENKNITVAELDAQIYEQLAENTQEAEPVVRNISIYISEETAGLSEEELCTYAAEAAMEQEINAFCLKQVQAYAPPLVFEEDAE